MNSVRTWPVSEELEWTEERGRRPWGRARDTSLSARPSKRKQDQRQRRGTRASPRDLIAFLRSHMAQGEEQLGLRHGGTRGPGLASFWNCELVPGPRTTSLCAVKPPPRPSEAAPGHGSETQEQDASFLQEPSARPHRAGGRGAWRPAAAGGSQSGPAAATHISALKQRRKAKEESEEA